MNENERDVYRKKGKRQLIKDRSTLFEREKYRQRECRKERKTVGEKSISDIENYEKRENQNIIFEKAKI